MFPRSAKKTIFNARENEYPLRFSEIIGFSLYLSTVYSTQTQSKTSKLNPNLDDHKILLNAYRYNMSDTSSNKFKTPQFKDLVFGTENDKKYWWPILYGVVIPSRLAIMFLKVFTEVPLRIFDMACEKSAYDSYRFVAKSWQAPISYGKIAPIAGACIVCIITAPFAVVAKLASLTVRSVLSHAETWRGASKFDEKYFKKTKILGVGPCEAAARVFSVACISVACVFFPPLVMKFGASIATAATTTVRAAIIPVIATIKNKINNWLFPEPIPKPKTHTILPTQSARSSKKNTSLASSSSSRNITNSSTSHAGLFSVHSNSSDKVSPEFKSFYLRAQSSSESKASSSSLNNTSCP